MARPRTFDEKDILEKATNAFWRNGYADTSITDLEEATGLKRTSLYAAFGDKDSFFFKCLKHYQSKARHILNNIFLDISDPSTAFKKLLTQSVEQAFLDPERKCCLINKIGVERFQRCDKVTDFIANNRKEVLQIWVAYLHKNGYTKNEATRKASFMFTLLAGLMSDVRAGAAKEELKQTLEQGLIIFNA